MNYYYYSIRDKTNVAVCKSQGRNCESTGRIVVVRTTPGCTTLQTFRYQLINSRTSLYSKLFSK